MPDEYMVKYRGAFEGTMKTASCVAKCLFDAMILNANPEGIVLGSREHWASYLQYPPVEISEIDEALQFLESPDPSSTHPDEEGRRIVPLGPNRWRIVNYLHFKYWADVERRRSLRAATQARYRAKQEMEDPGSVERSPQKRSSARGSSTFVAPTREECRQWFQSRAYGASEGDRFFNYFENCGWRLSGGKGTKMKNWELAASNWASRLRKPSGSSVEGPSAARVEALKAEMDALESGG